MIDTFIIDPSEVGFIIVIEESNNKIKYLGKENTFIITDKRLEQNIEHECLDKLVLFNSDEDGICEAVNEYRKKGINARMFSVFKDKGHKILDIDETEGYIKYNLIISEQVDSWVYAEGVVL